MAAACCLCSRCGVRTFSRAGRTFTFRLVRSSSLMTYVKLKDNENQVYFLWEKVEVSADSACSPAEPADGDADCDDSHDASFSTSSSSLPSPPAAGRD